MMYSDFDTNRIMAIFDDCRVVKKGKGKHAKSYIDNAGCTFDIETTSFYENGEKRAVPYSYQITFYNEKGEIVTYLYRVIEDAVKLLTEVSNMLFIKYGILICYIHNASFDLGFTQTYFPIKEMFCNGSKRAIMFARTNTLEFRCSLMLTCLSLAQLSKDTEDSKLTFNYDLPRNALTPLSQDELDYMEADTIILAQYFINKIKTEGGIAELPYTKTGYPRRRFRNNCLKNDDYRHLMRELTLEMDELELWEEAFQGGYCHANAHYVQDVIPSVDSMDLTSAYPSVYFRSYPMGKGEKVEVHSQKEAIDYMTNYHCLMGVRLTGIECKYPFPLISVSKVKYFESDNDKFEPVEDNGRIVSYDDTIFIVVDEVTFRCICNVYSIAKWEISNMWIYRKGLLPKPFLEVVLKDLYYKKTAFKGMKGVNPETNHDYALDLQQAKADLNGSYGMSCQRVIMDEMELMYNEDYDCFMMEDKTYEDEVEEYGAKAEQLHKYNTSRQRFTFYPWACYITAYVREVLLGAQLELVQIDNDPKSDTFGEFICNDWIYSDTDSVKCINLDKHMPYFKAFNHNLYSVYKVVCDTYGWTLDDFEPKDHKGNKHLLGEWDYEACEGYKYSYQYFKTLGCKRYAYTEWNEKKQDFEFHITVSGLKKHGKLKVEESKKLGYNVYEYGADNYIWDNGGFDFFNDKMVIPAEYSGRIVHTYIDTKTEGDLTDYLGNVYHYTQNTAIHLEKAPYSLTLSQKFIDFLTTTKEWK